MHPQGLAAQVRSAAVMGFGLATSERHVYDPEYGRPVNKAISSRTSYLDTPATIDGQRLVRDEKPVRRKVSASQSKGLHLQRSFVRCQKR